MNVGTTSVWSGLLLAILNAVALSLSFVAMAPEAARGFLANVVLLTLVTWPFASGAHYLATRFVGVTPTPVMDAILGRGGMGHALSRVPLGGLFAIPGVVLSIGIVLLMPYEVTDPEGVPFAGMTPLESLVANLMVITEEVVFRLLLFFPLIALLGARRVSRAGRPPWQFWVAVLVTDLLFAYAHVGIASGIGMDPGEYLLVSIVQKGLAVGTIFAWVAWRYGLEAAMYAHYTANVLILLVAAFAGG